MSIVIVNIIKLVAALGLLNVWILRFNKATAYRGGEANSMIEEFAEYGLPVWFCYLIGLLKVGSAFALLGSLWLPSLGLPAAALIVGLMVGAVSMHIKVKDPIKKLLPASAMLVMALGICASTIVG